MMSDFRLAIEISDEEYCISDELRGQIGPLLPTESPGPRGGRPRMDNRKAMEAILYIFRSGCRWRPLPHSLGSPGATPLPGMAGRLRLSTPMAGRAPGIRRDEGAGIVWQAIGGIEMGKFLVGVLVAAAILASAFNSDAKVLAAEDDWARKTDMPTPRPAPSDSVLDGEIYVTAGTSQKVIRAEIENPCK